MLQSWILKRFILPISQLWTAFHRERQEVSEGERGAGTIGVIIAAPMDTHTQTHEYLHCPRVEKAALKAGCKFLIDLLFATMFY